MYNKEEIEDSLEFCKTAKEYYGVFFEEETKKEKKRLPLENAGLSAARVKGWRRPTSESKGLRTIHNIFVLAVCILLAYFIATMVIHYVAHQTWVEGDSMEPTLSDGDSIIIQKISYYFRNPRRYDVVVFPVVSFNDGSGQDNTYYVKRVIGLPGETVQIKEGKVYIDGKLLSDDTYCLSAILNSGNAGEPVILKEDEYFVLGDNRNMSTDSRSDFVGMVHRKDIVGKVFMRIWPLSHFGPISGIIG